MKRSNMRSKDHLNCPSHCYVKACIVCAISLINQDSLRISASPHSSLMHHHCPVFVTILLTCDAAWQSRDNSSQNVTFPDCGENVQPSTSPVRTRENIHSSCSEEAHGLLWMCRVWGVLLITLCRSHGHLDSCHYWPIRGQDWCGLANEKTGAAVFISRCHHPDPGCQRSAQATWGYSW